VELACDPRLAELRRRLAAARAQGVPFSDAWGAATALVLAGASQFDAKMVYGPALAATAWAWQAAYTSVPPTRLESATTELWTFSTDGELGYLAYEPAA
jgi:hypothetical protein